MTHNPGIRIRILGDVMIVDGDRVYGAGPAKQSAVLAVLAMNVNRSVPVETLIERVWNRDASQAARASLYANVARLRKTLEPLGDIRIDRGDGNGYRLGAPADQVDLWCARNLSARARSAAEDVDLGEAAQLWRRVVNLYGDRPLGNISGSWADTVRARLRQERGNALEELFAVELARGRHRETLDEIAAAVAVDPLMENLVAQLMHALYLSGRKSEALTLYTTTSDRLGDELGIEPRQALRDMVSRIRSEDPGLEPRTPTVTGPGAGVPVSAEDLVPRQLPRAPGGFVGRVDASERIDRAVDNGHRVVLVTGMAGVGKTLLSLRWARSVADRHDDGQLFVDLLGSSDEAPRDVGEVLSGFLRALGVPGGDVPADLTERVALYRRLTTGKRLLVVLDNVADVDQLTPLLPGEGAQVIATSRKRLPGFDAEQVVSLDVLSHNESVELLSESLSPTLLDHDGEATRRLIELCGALPLALRIAAANLSEWPGITVADYVDELAAGDRFTTLAVPGDAEAAVLPAFDRSYRALGEPARLVFRALAVTPGQSVPPEAVMAMTGLDKDTVTEPADTVETAHLARRTDTGAWVMHDLLKEYARQLGTDEENATFRARLFAWYNRTARAAAEAVSPGAMMLPTDVADVPVPRFDDGVDAMSWFTAEEINLVAVTVAAADADAPEAWLLPDALRLYWARTSDFVSWERTAQAGLAAATRQDVPIAVAAMRYLLSMRARMAVDYTVGEEHLLAGLPAAQRAGDAVMTVNIYMGLADTANYHGDAAAAVDYCLRAMGAVDDLPLRQDTVVSVLLAIGYRQLGALEEAEAGLRRIVDHLRVAAPQKLVPALTMLGEVLTDLGRFTEAEQAVDEAHETVVAGTLPIERIRCMAEKSRLRLMQGDVEGAQRYARLAMTLSDESDSPMYRFTAVVACARAEPDPERAIARARSIVDSDERPDHLQHRIDARLIIASSHLRLGLDREALELAEQVAQTTRERNFRIHYAQALDLAAAALLKLGENDRAAAGARSALTLHRTTGYRWGEAMSHHLLAQATGDDEHRRLATSIADDIGGVIEPWAEISA